VFNWFEELQRLFATSSHFRLSDEAELIPQSTLP